MAKAHKFRLETVLSYKEKLVTALQTALGVLERARQDECRKLERLCEEQDSQVVRLEQRQTARKLDVDNIHVSLGYLAGLRKQIAAQSQAVEIAARKVEEKRCELQAKTQEKKVLEKLKERQMQAYQQELALAETKLSDEMVTSKFNLDRLYHLEVGNDA